MNPATTGHDEDAAAAEVLDADFLIFPFFEVNRKRLDLVVSS